ncbi:hypothetical protein V6N12_022401 [Hibiscus sabdariffa]|uniref:Uncharacterized protein n=1 Tax=Hibiscus sabdariffa TaxID=183260 RepID=A0ABR2FV59_9ROSI
MIVWLGGKEPVIGTYRRGTCPLVDMKSAATGALQRESSSQFSQKPYNKVDCRKSAPVQSCDCMVLGGKEPVIGSYRRDESSFLGALQALACLSTTMLPTSTGESDEKSSSSEAASIGHHRHKNNYVGPKEKDLAEEVNKSLTKGKCNAQSFIQSRQWKSFRVPEDFPTNNDPAISAIDSAVSTLQVPAEPELKIAHLNGFTVLLITLGLPKSCLWTVEYLNHVRLGHNKRGKNLNSNGSL